MSHLQGTDYVGSMVVFEDGLAKKSDYRHFKVATVPGNDDYAAMEEVLTRRLTALLAEEEAASVAGSGRAGRRGPERRRRGRRPGREAPSPGGDGSPTRPSCSCSTAASASSTWACRCWSPWG